MQKHASAFIYRTTVHFDLSIIVYLQGNEYIINMIDTDEIPLRAAPAPEKRLYGYILEHLTSYWLWQEKNAHCTSIVTTRVQSYNIVD